MRMGKVLVTVGAIAVLCQLSGCLLIGAAAAGAYISSVSDEDRERFHRLNIEREKNGLKPLTEEEWLMKETGEKKAEPTA